MEPKHNDEIDLSYEVGKLAARRNAAKILRRATRLLFPSALTEAEIEDLQHYVTLAGGVAEAAFDMVDEGISISEETYRSLALLNL